VSKDAPQDTGARVWQADAWDILAGCFATLTRDFSRSTVVRCIPRSRAPVGTWLA
jgi:hypothetical protein